MADFTITISNRIDLFGGIDDKWGQFDWGAFLWGEGTADLPCGVEHVISETLGFSDAITELEAQRNQSIFEELVIDGDSNDQELFDQAGYNYVFPSGTINRDTSVVTSYTVGTAPTDTWTSGVSGGTVWS